MQQDTEVTYRPISDVNPAKYGFVQIAPNDMIFSSKTLTDDPDWKVFVDAHFEDFSDSYYYAMQCDVTGSKSRKRKVYNLLQSIFDQETTDPALLMVKAVARYRGGMEEQDIVGKVISEILPYGGYTKSLNASNRYIWKLSDKKRFKKGVGRAFISTYIDSSFEKDIAWKMVKKHCYLKDGIWIYKNDRVRDIIEKTFLSYFNAKGVIVDEVILHEQKDFSGFVTFGKVVTEDGEDFLSLAKEVQQEKHPIIVGIASTTEPDREDERVSKSFLDKMKRTGKNLPITDNTHYASKAESVIGVVKETGGSDETFEIKAKLMKPSDSKAVAFIIKQMQTGIKYGLSVGGRVTKVFREFNEKMKKEIYVLDDGELFHIALTTQPANPETLGVAIGKSVTGKTIARDIKHNSRMAKNAPSEESVSAMILPDVAYPRDYKDGKVFKDYPHHFIAPSTGSLYLHKEMVTKAFAKAVEAQAPESVLNHLRTHLQIIGLEDQIETIESISKITEGLSNHTTVVENLTKELGDFFGIVRKVMDTSATAEMKKTLLAPAIAEASQSISKICENLLNSAE